MYTLDLRLLIVKSNSIDSLSSEKNSSPSVILVGDLGMILSKYSRNRTDLRSNCLMHRCPPMHHTWHFRYVWAWIKDWLVYSSHWSCNFCFMLYKSSSQNVLFLAFAFVYWVACILQMKVKAFSCNGSEIICHYCNTLFVDWGSLNMYWHCS